MNTLIAGDDVRASEAALSASVTAALASYPVPQSNRPQSIDHNPTDHNPFRSFSLGSFNMFDVRDENFIENKTNDENKENESNENHNCHKDEIIANVTKVCFNFDILAFELIFLSVKRKEEIA